MNSEAKTNYIRQRVVGAGAVELVVIALMEAQRRIGLAGRSLREQDIGAANTHLLRAQDIVWELRGAVNLEAGPLAVDLIRIYDFILDSLVEANVKKSDKRLTVVLEMLSTLIAAWREVEQAAPSGVHGNGVYKESGAELLAVASTGRTWRRPARTT